MVSHSSTNDQVQAKAVSRAINPLNFIISHYLVYPGYSIEFYEWRFMPFNTTVVLTLHLNTADALSVMTCQTTKKF